MKNTNSEVTSYANAVASVIVEAIDILDDMDESLPASAESPIIRKVLYACRDLICDYHSENTDRDVATAFMEKIF